MITKKTFAKQTITSFNKEVVYSSLIKISKQNLASTIFLIAGVCRSSTTAIEVSFAKAGYQCYYQPIKNAARYLMLKKPHTYLWNMPKNLTTDPIIIKETLGPYDEREIFNPYQVLENSGFLDKNIVGLWMFRNPIDSWISWQKKFSGCKLSVFVAAYKKQLDIVNYILLKNNKFAIMNHRALSFDKVQANVKKICELTGIKYNPNFIDWEKSSQDLPIELIVPEPAFFAKKFKNLIHDEGNPVGSTWNQPKLGLKLAEKVYINGITKKDLQIIADNKLTDIYFKLCQISKKQGFNFSTEKSLESSH